MAETKGAEDAAHSEIAPGSTAWMEVLVSIACAEVVHRIPCMHRMTVVSSALAAEHSNPAKPACCWSGGVPMENHPMGLGMCPCQ